MHYRCISQTSREEIENMSYHIDKIQESAQGMTESLEKATYSLAAKDDQMERLRHENKGAWDLASERLHELKMMNQINQDMEQHIQRLNAEVAKQAEKLQQADSDWDDLATSNAHSLELLREEAQVAKRMLLDDLDKARSELEQVKKDYAQAQEDRRSLESMNEEVKDQLANQIAESRDSFDEIKVEAAVELARIGAELEKSKAHTEYLTSQTKVAMDNLYADVSKYMKELSNKETKLTEANNKINRLSSENRLLKDELFSARLESEALQERIAAALNRIDDLLDKVDSSEANAHKTKEELGLAVACLNAEKAKTFARRAKALVGDDERYAQLFEMILGKEEKGGDSN